MARFSLRRLSMLLDNLGYALGTGKPRLIAKLVRNNILVRRGHALPRSLCIAVDYRCNMACDHCSARTLSSHTRSMLTLDELRSLADQAHAMGFFNIQLTGGEPLLRDDLEEVIARLSPRRNFIMISTNATLMDDARARSLKRAGVDVLSVSLDSSKPEIHNAFRKLDDAWHKTMRGIEAARRAGMRVSCSTVITHQNVRSQDLEDVAKLLAGMGCGMQLNWACPVGAWAGNREARLTPDDMIALDEFQERHHHVRTDFDGNYQHRGCPAAKEMMYITAYGDYLPCAFIPISYGNVKHEPLEAIRNRALREPFYQQYWPTCLSACNDDFYDELLIHTFDRPNPVPHSELLERPQSPKRVELCCSA